MTQYYVHLGIVLAVALVYLADTFLLKLDKIPYEKSDRFWAGGIALGSLVALTNGPGVVHSFLMWVVIFLAFSFVLVHDYDDEKRTWQGTGKLAVCWYLVIFSLHSFATY